MEQEWIERANHWAETRRATVAVAHARVANSPALAAHEAIIFDEAWADELDHLEWLEIADEAEIIAWAETIEQGVRDVAEA